MSTDDVILTFSTVANRPLFNPYEHPLSRKFLQSFPIELIILILLHHDGWTRSRISLLSSQWLIRPWAMLDSRVDRIPQGEIDGERQGRE